MAYVSTPDDEAFKHLVKSDLAYFKSCLGLRSDRSSGMHEPCPICGDQTALQFGSDKTRLGEHYFHCNKCGTNGDTITALNLVGRLPMKDVFKKLRNDFAGRMGQPSAHDQYHQQRQAELRNGSAAHANGTAHVNGKVANNQQPVFPPRQPPVQPTPLQSRPVNRGYALPQPSFVQNEQEIVHQPRPETVRVDPVIDLDMATQFVETQHQYLMTHWDLMKKYKRGITREVAEKYKLGFGEFFPVKFRPWSKAVAIPAAWVLPITNENGALKGVKIHCEESYTRYDGGKGEKCFWMPFGTTPFWRKEDKEKGVVESKPEHRYITLWPHPDTLKQKQLDDFSLDASWWLERLPVKLKTKFDNKVMEHKILLAYERAKPDDLLDGPEIWECRLRAFDSLKKEIMAEVMKTDDMFAKTTAETEAITDKPRCDWSKFIFIHPGELKALAGESMGYMATGWTGGESSMPPPQLLAKFAGQATCLMGDDDPPKRLLKKKDGQLVLGSDGLPEVLKVTCVGRSWAQRWGDALAIYGAEKVCLRYGGQKDADEF